MQREMETLAVFHILKNGGTTLIDRYKHNQGFAYQRIPEDIVYNYKQPNQITYYTHTCQLVPSIVFGHGVTFEWDHLLQNPVKYATILRDPRTRIMSAYNYFRLEMFNIHNHRTEIDFVTWLINCSRVLPTPVFHQYQQFSTQECLRTDYGKSFDYAKQHESYETAIENVDRLDYVFFVEDNYIKQFDKVAKKYGVKPNTKIKHQHVTKTYLERNKRKYYTYDDLNSQEQMMLLEFIAKDQEFYEHCKGKFA